MNPITRATIKSFCRICLESIEGKESDCKNIEDDENLAKWTQKIIPVSMQSLYSSATEADNDSKTKLICNICFVKISTFYDFHERSTCSAKALKLLLEEDRSLLTEEQLKKLKSFCRTCLRRQKDTAKIQKVCDVKEWLLECKLLMCNDDDEQLLPEIICKICYKKLRGFNSFHRLANQSFEYLKYALGTVEIEDIHSATVDGCNEEILLNNSVQNQYNETVIESIFLAEAHSADVDLKEDVENLEDDELSQEDRFTDMFEHKYIKDEDISSNEATQSSPKCEQVEGVIEIKVEDKSDAEIFMELPATSVEQQSALLMLKTPNCNEYEHNEESNMHTDDLESISSMKAENSVQRTARRSKNHKIEEDSNNSSKSSERKGSDHTEFKGLPIAVKVKRQRKCKKEYRGSYKCEECDKKFYKKERYEDHLEIVHKGNTNTRQCNTCLRTFNSMSSLDRHIKTIHDPLSVKNFPCSYCCRPFTCKDHLQTHIRSVHLKARPFKCKTCDKAFGAANTLRRHEMTHTTDYPFKCDICNWAFRQRSQLNLHMQRHNTDPSLMCPICKRAKSTLEELEAHKTQHHMKKQCFKCGKIFSKTAHLREHDMTVHLKLRPYKCSMCEKSFGKPYDCQQHELTHTNERPEVCGICKKAFPNRRSLRRHESRHRKLMQAKIQIEPGAENC